MDHNPFFLGQLLLGTLILAIVVVALLERSRRERHRLELQKAILERVGSVKDLAEFLATEQGQRFLGTLAPAHFHPHHRGLWTVRVGVVVLTVGVFLMVALHAPIFGSPVGMTPPPPLLLALFLVIAIGLGMLLSAAVSFMIARRLGLSNDRLASSKDDAV
jgi:hypothetical protein